MKNFVPTTLIFSEKFDHLFLYVFIFRNVFPEKRISYLCVRELWIFMTRTICKVIVHIIISILKT